jgi:hypothetical protein
VIYATVNDVREALAPEGDFNQHRHRRLPLRCQLTDSLVEASAEVDAKVKGAPFTTVPPIVQSITRDVAAYKATLTHRKGLELPPTHPVALRFAWAENMLTPRHSGQARSLPGHGGTAGDVAVANGYEGDLFTLEGEGIGADTRVLPRWNDGGLVMGDFDRKMAELAERVGDGRIVGRVSFSPEKIAVPMHEAGWATGPLRATPGAPILNYTTPGTGAGLPRGPPARRTASATSTTSRGRS